MNEIERLADLAYQNGDKALQRGWWDYVKNRAKQEGITETELIAEIERLKTKMSARKTQIGDHYADNLAGIGRSSAQ